MHPLLVLLAFAVAALVTYAVVLGLLTALSVRTSEDEPRSAERAARDERATR